MTKLMASEAIPAPLLVADWTTPTSSSRLSHSSGGVGVGKVLLFLIALTSASIAAAANWKNLGTDDRGITAYMDRDSISKDGGFRFYSIKFARPVADDHGMTYSVMKEKIDCEQKTVTTLGIAAYRADDSMIASSDEARPPPSSAAIERGQDGGRSLPPVILT